MKIGTLIIVFLWQISAFGQNYLMNGNPIKDCDGYFLDSGGNAQNYAANENFQSLICPDSTTGTHIELSFAGVDLRAGDELCFFDSTDISTTSFLGCASDFSTGIPFKIQATAANPSGCLTVLFTSDGSGQAKGWSATINCIPSCQLIQSELASSVPSADPIDDGWIDICKGDRVEFSGRALYAQNNLVYTQSDLTSDFVWDFGDGSLGYGPNVSHVYNEVGGYTVQLSITDQFGCTNSNFISQRVRISPKPDFNIADGIPDQICVGDTVSISSGVSQGAGIITAEPNEAHFTIERFRADSLPLPDGDGRVHSTKITLTDFAPGQVLTDVNDLLSVCINMEHSWMHDLEVNITCPSGKRVILQDQQEIIHEVYLGTPFHADEGFEPPIVGQGGEYCFTPTATNGNWTAFANDNVASKTPLPPGDYNSFENLEDLVGCPLNGDWTITVIDYWRDDNGWIFSWGLSFDQSIYPNVESFTPPLINYNWKENPTIFSNTPNLISAAPQNAGTTNYVFQVTDDFGCQFDTAVNILVLPPTHPDCYNCQELTTSLQDTSICEGDSIQLNAGALERIEEAISFESFPDYEFSKDNHPNNNPFETSIGINSIFPTTITDPLTDIVSVCLDIETSGWVSDLRISLRTPSGELLLLTEENGGQNNNYTNTCFSPTATNNITTATAPFTGAFLPNGNFSDLNGATINGDWTLILSDCCGNTDVNLLKSWTITFNNRNDISYTWSEPNGLNCTNCPDPISTPLEEITYQVLVEDSYACQAEDSIRIQVLNEFSSPELSLLSMENGNIVFIWTRIPDAPTYEVNINNNGWIPANGILTHTVKGFANGELVKFQVRASEEANLECGTGVAELSVIMCDLKVEIAELIDVSCFGFNDGTVRVDISGSNIFPNYILDGNIRQTEGNFVEIITPGAHTVEVDGGTGCKQSVEFTIEEPLPVNIEIDIDSVSCFGGNDGKAIANATGGDGNFEYTWQTSPFEITGPILFGQTPGTYTLSLKAAGCPEILETIQIFQPEPMRIDLLAADPKCFNSSDGEIQTVVRGGNPSYHYFWSDNSNEDQLTGISAGDYGLTVIDDQSCVSIANVMLSQPDELIIDATTTPANCSDSADGSVELTVNGGVENYSFTWSNGMITKDLQAVAAGTYELIVTDGNNCTKTLIEEVLAPEAISILLEGMPPNCSEGSDGTVSLSASGGVGELSFNWSTNTPQVTATIENLESGIYTVSVTDEHNCEASKSIELLAPLAVAFDEVVVTDVSCYGKSDGTASVTSVLHTQGSLTYQWDDLADSQTTATAEHLAKGAYEVIVTDSLGCKSITTVNIEEPDPLSLDFIVEDNLCFGDALGTLSANVSGGTADYQYNWSTLDSTKKITNLMSGKYIVELVDANACVFIDSVEIAGPEPISISTSVEDAICFGDDNGIISVAAMGGAGSFSYSLDGIDYQHSNTLLRLSAGTYTVYVQDRSACVDTVEVNIGEPEAFNIYAGDDIELEVGDSIQLDPQWWFNNGKVEFKWIVPYDGTLCCDTTKNCDTEVTCWNPIAAPEFTITYRLYGVDEMGCEDIDDITIKVNKERKVFVPTGFSPNGDSANDVLLLHGEEETKVKLFKVYDRWGEAVYEVADFFLNDPSIGWNGEFENKRLNSGVYVWLMKVEYIDGVEESFHGEVTLIR